MGQVRRGGAERGGGEGRVREIGGEGGFKKKQSIFI